MKGGLPGDKLTVTKADKMSFPFAGEIKKNPD